MRRFFIPTLTHNPRSNYKSLFADFDSFYRAFENTASNNGANRESASILPNYRMHEDEGVYSIEIDLPGVAESDIDVSVKDNVLTVSALRKRMVKAQNSENVESSANIENGENAANSENTENVKSAEMVEKIVAKYERSFTINDRIDVDNIAAITRDGMLLLSLPIAEEKDTTRKIEINKHLENN